MPKDTESPTNKVKQPDCPQECPLLSVGRDDIEHMNEFIQILLELSLDSGIDSHAQEIFEIIQQNFPEFVEQYEATPETLPRTLRQDIGHLVDLFEEQQKLTEDAIKLHARGCLGTAAMSRVVGGRVTYEANFCTSPHLPDTHKQTVNVTRTVI